ncbi:MAG TPA: fumarylacetoacetate hydrolase family protein [Dongiaceae bacterium]|nr:fumarylacetoacetate hydrolase family protein [Dongiaceae bacterium]
MRVATFSHRGIRSVGRLLPDGKHIQPLDLGPIAQHAGALALVQRATGGGTPQDLGDPVPLSEVKLAAPIPQPRRNIFCIGKNYRAHAEEVARSGKGSAAASDKDPVPTAPIVFTKVPESVIGPGETIRIDPRVSSKIDYEAELAVIIGRGGRHIAREDALDHVWGYTIVNDVTARDMQRRHQQWLLGKSQDTFCPMGPWLVTRDEIDIADTRIRCWVNDELRQDASTSDLIFDIPTLIATISAGITLLPGDIIATGTPAGVGIGFEPPKYLLPGDRVRIEIERIGVLENSVALWQDE